MALPYTLFPILVHLLLSLNYPERPGARNKEDNRQEKPEKREEKKESRTTITSKDRKENSDEDSSERANNTLTKESYPEKIERMTPDSTVGKKRKNRDKKTRESKRINVSTKSSPDKNEKKYGKTIRVKRLDSKKK